MSRPSGAANMGRLAVVGSERYHDKPTRAHQVPIPKTEEVGDVRSSVEQSQAIDVTSQSGQRRRGSNRKSSSQSQSDNQETPAVKHTRKKRKISEDDGADDDAKKTRGRPRLDLKDASAADRRRTQIRMAQRAYRNRKETTIASLEKQVQDLRGTNEQMTNIFMNLYDFAMQRGLATREPEVAKHLQSTTQQFLALASAAGELGADSPPQADVRSSVEFNVEEKPSPKLETSAPVKPSTPPLPQSTTSETTINAPWGYEITRDDTASMSLNENGYNQQPLMRGDHQIIAQATPDNASFVWDNMSMTDVQLYRGEEAAPSIPFQYSANLLESMPLPDSYAYAETSFARRLSRTSLERGWILINSTSDKAQLNGLFGFCLYYETPDDIKNRIRGLLAATSSGALFNWRQPFVHLGGAGTTYPIHNQSISGPLQPKFLTGMSMGPHSLLAIETRDKVMEDGFLSNVPGFEGTFFDSNDVEGYLRSFGIDISPHAELVEVDLDMLASLNLSPTGTDESSSPHQSPTTPPSPKPIAGHVLCNNDPSIAGVDVLESGDDMLASSFTSSAADQNLLYHFQWPDMSSSLPSFQTKSPQPFDFPSSLQMSYDFNIPPQNTPPRRTATLSVSTLVNG
ncbi:MAG: hypothetical protein M1818_005846 [Claussenomyces sp. TS43310]|nr:MAG: hypothetical protein M1818_005846 [Claussenomyces sp. TS43310]